MGCSSPENDAPAEISETEAMSVAVSFVPGAATSAERIDGVDERRWAVTVGMATGAEAVVELERAKGLLAEIHAEKGPFDYDLPPAGSGIATYANALSAARAAKPGAVDAWELNVSKSVWEFYIRTTDNQLWEIKLDAGTAAVTSAEEKAARD